MRAVYRKTRGYRRRRLLPRSAVLAVCLSIVAGFSLLAESPWEETRGQHFVVYYVSERLFADKVLSVAEQHYKRVAAELGYPRYSDFWTWGNRVKIYLYPDKAAFIAATGQNEWSAGMANYTDKFIASFSGSAGFIDGILPHETAHLIFRDFVGFKGEVPLWLDEGVAQWMEPAKRAVVTQAARYALVDGSFIPFREMMALDIREKREQELVDRFYLQAASVVGFLIESYGSRKFTEFCRQLRDGKSIDEALKFTYPMSMRNVEDMERRWKGYLAKEE